MHFQVSVLQMGERLENMLHFSMVQFASEKGLLIWKLQFYRDHLGGKWKQRCIYVGAFLDQPKMRTFLP